MKLHVDSAIKKYLSASPVRFHMPGHKGGKFLNNNCKKDVTELSFIGNERAVRLAEEDCAKILGAPHLRFLTDGATSGILASVHAVKDFGKKLIINRTAHKSVYNAVKLLGIEPIIIGENFIDGLPSMVTVEEVENALNSNNDIIGALLTYPDYYGRTFDIEGISKALKKANKIFIVDNAHGNHYAFYGENVYAGKFADIWIDGVHKTNLTLNQGAIICCRQEFNNSVDESVDIFSTTSPSYPILSSIEYGIKYSYERGERDFSRLNRSLEKIKEELHGLGISTLKSKDFLKLCVDIEGSMLDISLAEKLLEENGIFAELIGSRYILFMFSAKTKERELKKIPKVLKKLKPKEIFKGQTYIKPQRVISYLDAVNGETEYVTVKDAVGRVCAENFGIFPPCYPVCTAGEIINKEAIKLIEGKEIFGVRDNKIKTLKKI